MPPEEDREDNNDTIPHQDLVEAIAEDVIADAVQPDAVTIADAVAAVGANPTKAEFDAVVTKLNALLAVLRGIDVIAGA